MPRESRSGSQRRERILDAAFDLFVEQGFQGTTISEVERRVGLAVGTGSLYHHFASKEALLRAAVEREAARSMADVEQERAAIVWPSEQKEQLVLAAKLALGHLRRFDKLFRLLEAEGDRTPDLRQAITDALYGSNALGSWLEDPSRLVSIAALAGYHAFRHVSGGPFTAVTEDEFIEALVAVIPAGRPPGVDRETYEALREARAD